MLRTPLVADTASITASWVTGENVRLLFVPVLRAGFIIPSASLLHQTDFLLRCAHRTRASHRAVGVSECRIVEWRRVELRWWQLQATLQSICNEIQLPLNLCAQVQRRLPNLPDRLAEVQRASSTQRADQGNWRGRRARRKRAWREQVSWAPISVDNRQSSNTAFLSFLEY